MAQLLDQSRMKYERKLQVIGELNDPSGRPWSEVKLGNAGTTGYVFKRLLTSCK